MMTMTLTLEPEFEERLKWEAGRNGLSAEEYAKRALDEHLSEAERERRAKLIATLCSWNEQEVDDDYCARTLPPARRRTRIWAETFSARVERNLLVDQEIVAAHYLTATEDENHATSHYQ